MLDLNALRDFVAVIREGSFSGAAHSLGVPKSTISKRVQDLEAALEVRLIERTTRSLRLTAEGTAFHARAIRIVTEAEEAERFLKVHGDEPRGHLRVTATQLFGQIYLGTLAASYRAKHPHATIEIVLVDRLVDLIEEGFDAAIRIGTLADSGLISRTIAEDGNVIVANPATISRYGIPSQPTQLSHLPCVTFQTAATGKAVWRFSKGNIVKDIQIEPVITVNAQMALRDACLAGAGFASLPRFIVAEDIAAGRLVAVLQDWSGANVPISVVYPSARFLNARLRAFIQLLVERFPDRRL
jgi:DNA-binding transcriptional LysR family regulator